MTKLTSLALDFDGTIASDDRCDPSVLAAIASVRAGGTIVLLVTGRILEDLRKVVDDLLFVDAVVAENGAIIHFPGADHTVELAPRLPEAFTREIARRKIPFRAGHSLLDAAADDSEALVDAIRALELPLVPIFNRSRVMILPQGVSKATGLKAALDILRLSPRNTLAIGDAENDHELLRLAEVGVAVEWGSAALQRAADMVVPGHGPAAVAAFIAPLAESRTLPNPARARRLLRLGTAEDGSDFSLAVRGRNVLIAGDARSGKSWVAGLLSEQLVLHGYSVCVIDPEGDYRSLEALPGVSVLGGDEAPPSPRELARALRYPDHSVVLDLSHLPLDRKVEYVRAVLPALNEVRRQRGVPHRVLIDEAHYFLHTPGAAALLDFDLNGYTIVTYWASRLPPEALAKSEVMLVTCESEPDEVEALWHHCAGRAGADSSTWRARLGHLPLGQAVALPVTEEAAGTLRFFMIGRRLTPHVRHREKYVDVPVSEPRGFAFGGDGRGGPPRRAVTLRDFVFALEAMTAEEVAPYLRRGDFSQWIGDVFGDHALAADLAAVEGEFRRTGNPDAVRDLTATVRGRYQLAE